MIDQNVVAFVVFVDKSDENFSCQNTYKFRTIKYKD